MPTEKEEQDFFEYMENEFERWNTKPNTLIIEKSKFEEFKTLFHPKEDSFFFKEDNGFFIDFEGNFLTVVVVRDDCLSSGEFGFGVGA